MTHILMIEDDLELAEILMEYLEQFDIAITIADDPYLGLSTLDTKKFDLKPESIAELDKLVLLLNDNPKLKIEIDGHTDNIGLAKDNLTLSNNRAKAVVDYLSAKGIVITRLIYKGFGAAKPIADNTTDTGKSQNRRTELSVISN